MKFESKHEFDQPASTVIKMFTDPSYFTRKYEALGFRDIQVLDQQRSDKAFSIKVRYTAHNDVPIPDFAKKFIPADSIVTQQDSWNPQTKTGRLDVEVKGTPVKIACDMQLRDTGSGSANTLKWTISCSIPLIGGKIEKLTAEDIQSKAGNDIDATRRILADYV